MTKLGSFVEYKDSGVEWFPRLPASWSATKLKHISERLPGGTPDTSIDDYWRTDGSGSPWVSIGDMSGRQIISTTAKSLTEQALASKPLPIGKPGTLLFAMYASVGEVTPLGIHASWNQALLGIEARSKADTRFLYYALQSIRDWLPALYRSNTQNNLNADQVGNFDIPLPPVEIQKSISGYLDRQTAQIDELIGKQERLIALLAEKHQAIITDAVTKGLDPAAPTKPSGIPWLGDVAANWTIVDLKHVIHVLTGFPFRSEDFSDAPEDVALLRGMNINPGRTNWSDTVRIDVSQANEYADYSLELGDLVLGLDRPIVSDGVRVCAIGPDDLPSILLQRVARIRSNASVDQDFVAHLLSSSIFSNYLEPLFTGVSVPHMSPGQLGEFKMALPPLDEQISISRYLKDTLKSLNDIADKAGGVISLLKERRSSLISAAVTGKIKVDA